MNCPICEKVISKKPVVFQKKYFPRLSQDQAICKGCYESWPEGYVYNMLAPVEGEKKEIKRDYVALYKKKLGKRYSKMRIAILIFLIIFILPMVLQVIRTGYLYIDIFFLFLIGCLVPTDMTVRRFFKITRPSITTDIDDVILQTKKLKKRYGIIRIVTLISLSIYTLTRIFQISPSGIISFSFYLSLGNTKISFDILLFIFIGCLLSADWSIRRLFEIGAMTPEEKEMLAEKVKPARCGICDAVQPFEVHSLRGGHFPEGVVLLKDSYPDLPHDAFVCEKCRIKHPSTKAIYDYLAQVAARRGKPES